MPNHAKKTTKSSQLSIVTARLTCPTFFDFTHFSGSEEYFWAFERISLYPPPVRKFAVLAGRPFEIFDGGKDHLVTLIKAVQVQRNNAVHPMNERITDETVRLSYLAFPFALQKMEQLREWFLNNSNVL
jgi:hypothetical protein